MTRRVRSTSLPPPTPRGYALPLVVLLAFIAAVASTILLERQADSRQGVQQQLDAYRNHHVREGVREMLEMWASYFRRPIERDLDGVIGFDLSLADGSRVEVRLSDAQGSLRRVTLLTGDIGNAPVWASNKASRKLQDQGFTTREFLRNRGPVRVSINAAPTEVLTALVESISDDGAGGLFAAAVMAKRAEKRIVQQDLGPLLQQSGLSPNDQLYLTPMLAVEPSLWRVEAEVYDSVGRVTSVQGGLAEGSLRAGGGGAASASSTWRVVTWSELSPEERALFQARP